MFPSFKRVSSALMSMALVAGIVPADAYAAGVATVRGVPAGGAPTAMPPVTLSLRQPLAGPALLPGTPAALSATLSAAAAQPFAAAPAVPAAPVASPQRVPVDVVAPAEAVERYTPEQKSDLASVIALMGKRLFTWDQVTVRTPDSIFDGASQPLIKVEDLFKAPQAGELERLAIRYGRLSAEQQAQLRKDGTFSVPSEDFPGQTHVWRASGLLQKGGENIKASLRSDSADAAAEYLVNLPETIKGRQTLSLRSGARNFFEGLYETAGLAVGVSETRARFSAGEVERRRLERLSEFMSEKLPAKDLALYDLALMEKASPIVKKLEQEAAGRWEAKADAVKDELSQKIKDPQALADALALAEQKEFWQALSASAELEALHAGLGKMLVARGRAKQSIKSILNEGTKQVSARGAAVAAQLREKRPILSLIPAWLEARVGEAERAEAQRLIPWTQEKIARAVAGHGLADEFAAEVAFRDVWAPVAASMPAYQTGNREFDWNYRIWRRANWTVEQDPESKSFSGSQTRTIVRSTEDAFWRLSNLAQRAMTAANNMLYWLLSTNLTYGPLGVKSLFGSAPFAYRWVLDGENGQWVETSARRQTLSTRLSGFRAQRRAMLEAHEKKSSYSFFLGKLGERVILFFTADLAIGIVAPLLVAVFQPLLTVLNTVVSASLAVAVPFVFAPAYSAAVWALHALVFDSEGTTYGRWRSSLKKSFGLVGLALLASGAWYLAGRFGINFLSGYWLAGVVAVIAANGPLFPWVGTLLKKAGLYGAAAFIGSALKSVLHVVAGPVRAVFGGVRYAARTTYDAAMSLPLRRLARVPGAPGMFVKRVAGPGLSSEYFFQVSPDLPLVAAWAALESGELTRYNSEMTALIAEPQKAYAEFAAVLDVLTSGNNAGRANSPAFKVIAEKEAANKKVLSEAVSKRAELYSRLLTVPHAGKIKLAAPELMETIKKSSVLAERFYTKIMTDQKWSAEKIKAFWKDSGLEADDWVGVAKKTLSTVFGAEILVPLEDADKTLRIKVTAPDLADYVKGLEDGIIPGQLDNVDIGGLERPAQADVKTSVPRIGGGDLQGGIL